ncbi:DUF2027 domain-containing protein [Paludibacter sp. 221]|nr:DUF2027 domain-containing protein [Paludibacter sp. 221]
MIMKIGDTVRFLNSIGGGRVTRIDDKKSLVYVEDEDGFEVPALMREVVVIQNVSETTNIPKKDFGSKNEEVQAKPMPVYTEPQPEPEPIVETPEGDTLNAVLAFFPVDIKQLQTTSYECYLVNDSNYFLFYNFVIGAKDARKSVANGRIEPNTQELIARVSKDDLNDWEHLQAQIIAFKEGKAYSRQSVIDAHIRLNTVKFYKLHSFAENEYFDEPSLLVDLIAEKEKQTLAEVSPEEIKKALYTKEEKPRQRPRVVKKEQPEGKNVIEVDLHISQLVDSTAGMNNADMLQLQLDKFHAVLDENRNKKGQKIVFIHGKGEGVLRKEIEKQLKTKYKHYYFQDASFREYGFGATMVTIK